MGLNLTLGFGLMLVYGLVPGLTSTFVYILSLLIGITVGYWAVLVTMAAAAMRPPAISNHTSAESENDVVTDYENCATS